MTKDHLTFGFSRCFFFFFLIKSCYESIIFVSFAWCDCVCSISTLSPYTGRQYNEYPACILGCGPPDGRD